MRRQKYLDREYVVAKKGHKGFFKTNLVCKDTTIVDAGIFKTNCIFDAINKLKQSIPVGFNSTNRYTQEYAVPKMGEVFKYIESTERKETYITYVIVGNKSRYILTEYSSGRVRLQKISLRTTSVNTIKEAIIRTLIPKIHHRKTIQTRSIAV